jgi:hypothetical protein
LSFSSLRERNSCSIKGRRLEGVSSLLMMNLNNLKKLKSASILPRKYLSEGL